ncbi:MurR/RpiR family transcriptional regulator [Amycolatopsis sp. DSM 110486]|uniref:MurR/RpiR family transcriptional regulator n=1 Tax=Amycolatopsis sp. DSM 110486 TaxID=2865832 RepID=UPI001C69A8C0|nr:MurR/RpiR family transcriptional regulator [Amycolatopsis sp. DSM 110486]QYN18982.1 MurR/RpiR family transcriptional regulator [Amycolatopsis sp. DSM 110486]
MVATDPPGSLEERVAARREGLTATELKVASYLASHPDEVAFASADALGRATETSDATVIRTVKALGYTGMPALKRILQEQVREHLTPAGRLGRRVDVVGSAPDDLLSNVFTESILLLQEAQRSIRSDQFAAAVVALSSAREVVVMGTGALGMLGRYLTLRLTRFGYRTRDALTSGFLLADDLLRLTEQDVVVLVVHEKVTVEIEVALDHCREVGAKVILVTDTLGEALRDRVSIVLTTPAGSSQMYKMQTTTLALFEALTLAIAAQQQEPALHAMALMNRLRDELRYRPDH